MFTARAAKSLPVLRQYQSKQLYAAGSNLRPFFSFSGGDKGPKDEEVRALFSVWNNALATGDSATVASCYAKDAVLLPTVSDTPRTSPALIKDYFDAFLKRKPQGVITDGYIRSGEGFAKDSGIYEFTMGDTGDKVKARYSFVYVKEDGKWKILHHHSSVMPEGITIGKKIEKDEVRSLFNLWNDALATGDSAKVAARYSKNAVLLPTVSDKPRNNNDLIVDYFNNFLTLKPQGVIDSGDILIGTNWAQDAGIYTFTLGANGKKVQARYSFVYVYEDGEWKISHHHSSMMPEKIVVPEPVTKEQVRSFFNLWNDALATLDPKKVAARYAKDAVLLPTVSDIPRTSPDLIENYFEAFLQKKPQGVIDSGNIKIGANWAQDAGIYTFTMGNDGSKVQGRYSFIYVFEDGEWKISHHHSSVMPEAFLNPKAPAQ
ncbi:hypothetical protein FisN_1Lh074 [Fistulifera solaris]|uniref:Calcium/calmodulin-dependent protein kinase II association-domain domain-containing protein n=1 Tax=Fistulifera solaris TaxID=1519565 RepID=A0A1Z5K4U5_FISSO|nr:hypothetical protein FisN_1Lh074 [Fistulifera solaris]|eukprot:GAX21245.1 hypothetical protein FisN_1Lh074 [Fistulifera solaris]